MCSLVTSAPVSKVTLSRPSTGRTAMTSASDLAWTRHGYPSHQVHRMHVLAGRFASSSRIPHGAWNGWYPPLANFSVICWILSSCETAGHG